MSVFLKVSQIKWLLYLLFINVLDLKEVAQKLHAQQVENENSETENLNPFEGAAQIQIQGNLQDLKLKEQQDRLARVEELEGDINDLHEMYVQVNEMVDDQRRDVDYVTESVESSNVNVQAGLRQLIKAHK